MPRKTMSSIKGLKIVTKNFSYESQDLVYCNKKCDNKNIHEQSLKRKINKYLSSIEAVT